MGKQQTREHKEKLSKARKKAHTKTQEKFIKEWQEGKVSGGNLNLSIPLKRFLFDKYDNTCAIGSVNLEDFEFTDIAKYILNGKTCNWNEKRPSFRKGKLYMGLSSLELCHLNDNPFDHSYRNVLPICPNHHRIITIPPARKGKLYKEKTGRPARKVLTKQKALETGSRREKGSRIFSQEYVDKRKADTGKKLEKPAYRSSKLGNKEKLREYESIDWEKVTIVDEQGIEWT